MLEHYMEAVSSYAGDIDDLVNLIFWITGVWFVAAQGVFFYLMFRYKKKDGVKSEYVTGEEHHQKKWIEIPHAAVLICDIFVIYGAINVWVDIKQNMPEADSTIRVTAQQWAWTFTHPGPDNELDTDDDIRMADELHVEVGKTYHYKLEAKDVMHDFSVPVFRLKQDAVPGRVISGWFQPTNTGEYDIQCAEMCGIGHGIMKARIHIESSEAHAAWVAEHSNGQAFADASGSQL